MNNQKTSNSIPTPFATKIGNTISNLFIGYAKHPQCGKKIYSPFSKDLPGKCSQCGAKIYETCQTGVFDAPKHNHSNY
jgi:hypothetical protein